MLIMTGDHLKQLLATGLYNFKRSFHTDLSTAHRRWAFDPIGGCNITDAVLYMCNKHTAALSLSSMLITWQVEHFADCGV